MEVRRDAVVGSEPGGRGREIRPMGTDASVRRRDSSGFSVSVIRFVARLRSSPGHDLPLHPPPKFGGRVARRCHSNVAFERLDGTLRLRAVEAVDRTGFVPQCLQGPLYVADQSAPVGRRFFDSFRRAEGVRPCCAFLRRPAFRGLRILVSPVSLTSPRRSWL